LILILLHSIRYYLNNDVSGILCKVKDHKELAEKLFILIKDYAKRTNLAFNARKTLENMHDINTLNDNLIKIYENVLNK